MPVVELETGGGTLLVDVDESESGYQPTGLEKAMTERARHLTEQISETLGELGEGLSRARARMNELSPDRMEVELGLRLSTKGDVILAKAEADAHVKVKLVWEAERGGADG